MKRSPMRGILAILLVVTGISTIFSCSDGGGTPAHDTKASGPIPWRKDFAAAGAEARKLHHPMLIEFSATWCGPCRDMAATTWMDPHVAKALAGYVAVQIDVDEQPQLASQYGADSIPMYAVLDEKGTVVKSGKGLRNSDEFIEWLNAPVGAPAVAQ